jgi:flagellar M-ring protein FliF
MASVPAEATSDNMPAAPDSGSETGTQESRSDLLFGFNRLNILRQIGLMVGLAASVALGVAVVLWAQEPNYQPVVGDLSSYNPADVTTILERNGIPYRMEPRTGALLVPSGQVYDARLKLAAEGVTDQKTMGYEILDQEQGLGTSQFMETISYRRGLEGELARTISSLRSVRGARVHLAIPQRSVFIRDSRTPTASVFLEVLAGRRLEQEQIASIINLVAGSIPELTKDNVTVVDQSGNLLTGQEEDSNARKIEDQYQYTGKMEERLTRRVASMIDPIIGDGRFRAEVTADLDFSAVERAEELFNPEQRAVRSERELSERRAASSAGGVPGALSNQPPGQTGVPEQVQQGADGAPAAPPVNVREEATRNYEMDRTVSYTRQEQGAIKRLTVAVAVDDRKVVDPQSGAVSYEPWSEEELRRLAMLVRDAVGYSAARGDSVTVMNTAFAQEQPVEFEPPAFWEQPWFWDLMKQVLAGLVILVLVLGLLRPTLKSLSGGGRNGREGAGGEGDSEGLAGLEGGDALRNAVAGQDDLLLPGATDSYDRELNALKGLIAEDPARVAQVMRQWVNVDE